MCTPACTVGAHMDALTNALQTMEDAPVVAVEVTDTHRGALSWMLSAVARNPHIKEMWIVSEHASLLSLLQDVAVFGRNKQWHVCVPAHAIPYADAAQMQLLIDTMRTCTDHVEVHTKDGSPVPILLMIALSGVGHTSSASSV